MLYNSEHKKFFENLLFKFIPKTLQRLNSQFFFLLPLRGIPENPVYIKKIKLKTLNKCIIPILI